MSEDTTSGDDTPDDDADSPPNTEDVQEELQKGRERLQEEAGKAVEGFDEGIVDLLAWVLDTETRARIYVYLRAHPASTSEEIAEGTGLYPSTVREALAELAEEGKVTREKRESEGAGNNPYEYDAIAPSDLVGGVVSDVQQELNTVFNLDDHLGSAEIDPDSEPVRITVDEADDGDGEDVAVDAHDEDDVDAHGEADVDDEDVAVDAVDEVEDDEEPDDDGDES
jgi:predicted transcriptional regulator